jgi:ribosomal protein S6--L-glutamate ligase
MADRPYLTVVFRPDDFDPAFLDKATERFFSVSTQDANRNGFHFRAIPHHELIPGCCGQPQLWHDGRDLLQEKQFFQVDDFSWDPQAHHHLKAIHRTVQASSSILLNQFFVRSGHLATDKLSIVQHATALGVPTLATIAVPFGRYGRTVLPLIDTMIGGGPYILKPREMGMGFSVLKVETMEELTSAIDLAAQTGIGYVVQPYRPNSGDVRVFVVGRQVIATQHRRPTAGRYLANLSRDGTSTAGARFDNTGEASLRIADSLDADCLEVDWLLTDDGPVLNEWSSGFGGYASLPDPDRTTVSDAYFAWAATLWPPTAARDLAEPAP